ncbi:MAG: hypothetical protein ACRCUY_03780, partial [Thermoguttaceae bacterium]
MINSHLHEYVLRDLQKHFPNLDVQVGSIQLVEQKGIQISHLELNLPAEKQGCQNRPLLIVEEVFLECPVSVKTLLMQ